MPLNKDTTGVAFIHRIRSGAFDCFGRIKRQFNFLKPANARRITSEIKKYIPTKLTRWELLLIFIDLVVSRYRYKATQDDYLIFQFWKKSRYGRKKVITEGQGVAIWQSFNPPEFDHLFREKYQTYQMFKPFYGRNVVRYHGTNFSHDVSEFVAANRRFFLKPNDGSAGIGTRVVDINEYDNDFEQFFLEIQGGDWVFEQLIEQEENIAQIHPYSINTIRVNTVVTKSGIKVMTAAFKVGNGQSIADNFHQGGIAAPVDLASGIVCGTPVDRWNRTFIHHPLSGVKLTGFQIPHWQQVIELSRKLAAVVPQVRYVGWDIAITQDGTPIVVEGNVHPGFQVHSVVLENMKSEYLSVLKM